MSLKWIDVKDRMPEREERVLAFSPVQHNDLRYRIMDGQFIRLCRDVTKWIPISDLEKEIE